MVILARSCYNSFLFSVIDGKEMFRNARYKITMRNESDIPPEKGTYILILRLDQTVQMTIGRLGCFTMFAGYYAYVGSAFGTGGLKARIEHHLETPERLRWHIDYLRRHSSPAEVWFSTESRKMEQEWADALRHIPSFRILIPRFGSSEYHRSHITHLFYSKRKPSFEAFSTRMREQFDMPVQIQRIPLS